MWGWSPPDLPADTTLKRRVDQVLPRTGTAYILYWAVVVALEFGLAPHLATRERLVVEGVAGLFGGGWCVINFWRCRHAHCVVSGSGWLALSAFFFVEAGIGRSLIGRFDQPVFVAVLVAALVFEGLWYRLRGTKAIAPHAAGSEGSA